MRDDGDLPEDLISRYLRGQLGPAELADFEIRMLEQPRLFEAVQQADGLQEAFRDQGSVSDRPLDSDGKVARLAARQWIRQPLSMAASLLLGVSILLWSSEALRRDAGILGESGLAINSVVTLMPTRGSQEAVTVASGVHLLQVDVGISLNQSSYNLTLASDTGNERHELEVVADSNGMVRMLTPDSLRGSYTLTVTGLGDTEILERYQIRFE